MRIDKTQISGLQGMFTVICFFQASSLLASFLSTITKQDSWIVAIIAGLICLPIFWIFSAIIRCFPHKNLFQFFETVYGKVIGKGVSVFYLIFFVMLAVLNLKDLTAFSRLTLMNKTPNIVIIGVCMIVSSMAVRKGVKVVTRYSLLFAATSIVIILTTFLLLLNQFSFSNFLPILDLQPIKYVQATHVLLTVPLGEIIALGMIVPNIKFKKQDMRKYLFVGLGTAIATFLIIKVRDIAVLGNVFHILELPPLIALRLVNVGEALSRIEILFAVVLLMLMFFKITMLYYVVVISVAQIFEMEKFWHLTLVIGVFISIFALTFVDTNPVIHGAIAKETTPFIWGFLEFIFPAFTFLIALITKKTRTATQIKRGKIKNYKKSFIYGKMKPITENKGEK